MYQILFSNNAKSFIKKSIPALKKLLQESIDKIKNSPIEVLEALTGNLKGYYAYHLKFNSVAYRIFFEIQESAQTIVVLEIDTRENFYIIAKRKYKPIYHFS